MNRESYIKISTLLFLLATLSIKVLLEDKQHNERQRLFGYFDVIIRCIDVIKDQPDNTDTTRTSNQTISTIMDFRSEANLKSDSLLLILKENIGNAAIVYGYHNVLYKNLSTLDPGASLGVQSYNLTGTCHIPTVLWTTNNSGYGTSKSPASDFILLIPSHNFDSLYISNEPILLKRSFSGEISYLSIPKAIKPFLIYMKLKPEKVRLVGEEHDIEGNSIVELISYNKFLAEIVRLASLHNKKSYSVEQVSEALEDSLHGEKLALDLFGIHFSRNFFAIVFPFVYAFAGFVLFQATLTPKIDDKTITPVGFWGHTGVYSSFCLSFLSIIPITLATINYVPYISATALPQQPTSVKYLLVIIPLCFGFIFLTFGLIREVIRIIKS